MTDIQPTPQSPIPTTHPVALPYLSLFGPSIPGPLPMQLAPGFTTGPTPTGLMFLGQPYVGSSQTVAPIAWHGAFAPLDDRATTGPMVPGVFGPRPDVGGVGGGTGGGTGHPIGEPGGLHAVPEPASWCLLLVGGLVVWAVCERGRRANLRRMIG